MRSAAGPVAGLREVDPDEAAADGCKPSTGSVAATVPAAGPTAEEVEVPAQANLNRAITAFITAGVDAMVPASPMPLTPIGLVGLGVTVWSRSNAGNSAADGTR